MSFEELLAEINAYFFLKEFSFTKNQFTPLPGDEVEFADHVIWIKDILFLFQMKERSVEGETTADAERTWFEKRVVGTATKQIRDTLGYLNSSPSIRITNQLGHAFDVKQSEANPISIVLHMPHDKLPLERYRKKFHQSSTAGFIHIFPAVDYIGVCKTLITPVEIAEYLRHRERTLLKWPNSEDLDESALVGHYVNNLDIEPAADDAELLDGIADHEQNFSVQKILDGIRSRITYRNSNDVAVTDETIHYKILVEFLTLDRSFLLAVRERLRLSMEACNADESTKPYILACTRTGCGFLFVPFQKQDYDQRSELFGAYTGMAMYRLKVDRLIGVYFIKDGSMVLIEWRLAELPWKVDPEMENRIQELDPFRPLKNAVFDRYNPSRLPIQ